MVIPIRDQMEGNRVVAVDPEDPVTKVMQPRDVEDEDETRHGPE